MHSRISRGSLLLDGVSSARQTGFHGALPTGAVLLVLRNVLLCPLLMRALFLSNLVITSHRTEQPSSTRADRRSFSGVSTDSTSNRTDRGTTRSAAQQSALGRLLFVRWARGGDARRGVETGLICRPGAAFPLVLILLFGALILGRIDEKVVSERSEGPVTQ